MAVEDETWTNDGDTAPRRFKNGFLLLSLCLLTALLIGPDELTRQRGRQENIRPTAADSSSSAFDARIVTSLSHVGRAVLAELQTGSITGRTDLDEEGHGRTWDLDLDASLGHDDDDDEWFVVTPTNRLGSKEHIAIPRTCDPTKDRDCDKDFALPICTHDESRCDRPDKCRDKCRKWLKRNSCSTMDDETTTTSRALSSTDLSFPRPFSSVYSTVGGFACYNECCSTRRPRSFVAELDAMPPPSCRVVRSTRNDPIDDASPSPRKLCVGHSDQLVDTLYQILISAEHRIDISSLDAPDGRFLAAMRNAITYLHRANRSVRIRILIGVYGMSRGVDAILDELVRDIRPSSSFGDRIQETTVRVTVGYWAKSYPTFDAYQLLQVESPYVLEGDGVSFNHAKIIAVDGRVAFTGGHNLRTANYLTSSPVMDASVSVRGTVVAESAHRFLDVQWSHICDIASSSGGRGGITHGGKLVQVLRYVRELAWLWLTESFLSSVVGLTNLPDLSLAGMAQFPDIKPSEWECPTSLGGATENSDMSATSGVPVFTVGRLGGIATRPPKLNRDQTSDRAFEAMFRSAKKSIRLSHQDIGPPGGFDAKKLKVETPIYWMMFGSSWVMVSLCEAMLRGVNVQIVLSAASSTAAPEVNFSNGWSADDIVQMALWYLRHGASFGLSHSLSGAEIEKLVCDRFSVATARYLKGVKEWAFNERCPSRYDANGDCESDEARLFGLHTKVALIDDDAVYVGSQNLYSTPLTEWGLIIDDADAVQSIRAKFWNKLWDASWPGRESIAANGGMCLGTNKPSFLTGSGHIPSKSRQKKQPSWIACCTTKMASCSSTTLGSSTKKRDLHAILEKIARSCCKSCDAER